MTKVLLASRALWTMAIALVVAIFPCVLVAAEISSDKPAEALYLQLGQVGLDPARVYQVRGASLDRGAIQISLEDGTIAFTEDAMGRITGASFEGDGEILLTPPSEVERRSLSLFTGMAILEERFTSGYFRFNDDTFDELRPDLRATENKQEFIDRWGASAKNLAVVDAMRLLVTFSQFLPINGLAISEDPSKTRNDGDRFLHARLQGTKHGVFDVFFDSTAGEQIQAGQAKTVENGDTYYDLWTSFTTLQSNPSPANRGTAQPASDEKTAINRMSVLQYTISAAVTPPKQLHANTKMECEVGAGEVRMLTFELSRFLRIESVSLNGKPVEFIHNPALEGTQLARQGNDVVAVMLSEPKRAGEKFELEFEYGGEVLAEAGSGLLYVGARGTWYPNRGLEMANFDMEFTYPEGWTLVATGKPAQVSAGTAKIAGEQASRWISDRPIPLAGFNLGKYREATTRAGDVVVETYATVGVERSFPSVPIQVVTENPNETGSRPPEIVIPSRPSPAQTEVAVGESAARAIQYFAERFGPFPFSHLALTQMPGRDSQGWPGLIFLSSYVFLTEQQRQELHYEPYLILIQQQVPAHETAHQWWGDLITWTSYRDQWFSEGLANYCSLMMLEEKNPAGFHEVMEKYRRDLVEKNKEGITPMEAGPVTLGTRLWSSKFPGGYEAISYGRGTWLFHMLRTMLKDAQDKEDKKAKSGGSAEEPFMRALRRVREKYEGKSISTRELLDVFAEELPSSLRYEGKSSLDWFLEGWINGTSMPKLELRSVKLIPKGTGMSVSGTILQKEAPQDLVTSVPVYGVITGRQPVLLGRVFADGEESSFHLAAPAGVHKIELDPYETILTSVK